MKVNKKLKMPMIVFGILLFVAAITFRVISFFTESGNVSLSTTGSLYKACDVSCMAMRYNLISTLCLLLGLGVITFASRMGQISGIKLMISCLFFIGCITLSVFVQFKLAKLYGNGQGGNYKYCPADIHAQFGRQDDVHPILIHISNGCAIFGITALLL